MPSSPGYVRDYKREAAIESPQRKKQRVARNTARRVYERSYGAIPSGFDVDHKNPLSEGGSTSKSNLRVLKARTNRSYPRNSDGSINEDLYPLRRG